MGWYSLVPMDMKAGEVLFIMEIQLPAKLNSGFALEALSESVFSDGSGKEYRSVSLTAPGISGTVEEGFYLSNSIPNPFSGIAEIWYIIPGNARVSLRVTNILGEEVAVPVDDLSQDAGKYRIDFDCSACPAGVYTYQIEVHTAAEVYTDSKKMILAR